MSYQTVKIPRTLCDLHGSAGIPGLLKCDFWYNCAAADEISTDIARRCTIAEFLILHLVYSF